MEVCGGQTHTIVKYGIDQLLPAEVELVHGPGCPVCVTSLEMIDRAHAIASRPGRDLLLVRRHAPRARARAATCCSSSRRAATCAIVYSPLDAVNLAAANPDRRSSSSPSASRRPRPPNAMAVWLARKRRLTNFSVLVSHVLVPPAMTAILESPDNRVQGFLGPGHVCTVMGYAEYEPIAARYGVPIVVTGLRAARPARRRAADACGSSRRAGPRSRTSTPAPSAARATRRRSS